MNQNALAAEIAGATPKLLISPRVGEMGGSPEGGAVPLASQFGLPANDTGGRSTLPPSALLGISPTWGEIGSVNAFAISAESAGDVAARDRLLDRAMKPNWRRKSSEKIRRGRLPALALVARDEAGAVVGTVRLWNVALGAATPSHRGALLLGPLAVDPSIRSAGLGGALMRAAITDARAGGYGAIVLVGDPEYYARFGFSAQKTGELAMPGPFETHRLLALELDPGALDGAQGVIRPTGVAAGRKLEKAA
jgi:predicted N-acetyltransferase YhbS